MNSKKHLWMIAISVALASVLLVACGGSTPSEPTPVPPVPTPATSPDEHMGLGLDYHAQGKYEEASAEFREALRLDSDYAPAHSGLAMTYYDQGSLDQAMAECRKALGLDPDSEVAHYILGRAYYDQGNPVAAIAEYEAAIKIASDYEDAHFSLGIAYAAQDRWDDAAAEWNETINLFPDFAEAHYNLGLYYTSRDSDKAITAFQEAIRLNPDNATAYFKLGLLYTTQDMFDEAIAEYEEAIRLDPDYAEAHKFLGLEYAMLSRDREAVTELETYLRLQPDASDRMDMEQIIAELERPSVVELDASYHNAAGGYSLLYPAGWYYAERGGGAEVMFVESEENIDVLIKEAALIMFTSGPLDELTVNLGLTGIADLTEILEAGAAALDGEAGEIVIGEVDGYPAALTDISGTYQGSPYEGNLAIIVMENWAVQVTGMGPSDQWENYRSIFIDMFSNLIFEP